MKFCNKSSHFSMYYVYVYDQKFEIKYFLVKYYMQDG